MSDPITPNAPRPYNQRHGGLMAIAGLVVACLGGCTNNPYLSTPGGQPWQAPPGVAQTDPTTVQIAELNRRVRLLDDNNRQLHTQLAQSEQQAQLYRDELNLVRQQLSETANKLDAAAVAANDATQKYQGLAASTQLRGNATLRANTNLQQITNQFAAAGINAISDGNTLRIILPADQLFQPGSATLEPTSAPMLDAIAAQVKLIVPRQKIAIEGYTDNSPLYGGRFASNHQLAAAQSSSVMEMLTRRSGLPEAQFFTIAQGTNHPRADNSTPQGRAANRRIELVVYPDTF